jgi:hypothetical protein
MSPAEAQLDAPPSQHGCAVGQLTTHVLDECQFGDPDGKIRIALLGDSHAHQWLAALQVIARKHHWQVWMFEKASCPMIGLTVRLSVFDHSYPTCEPYRQSVLERLHSMGEWDAVVVAHASRYANYLGTADNKPLEPAEAVAAWGPAWAAMSDRLHEVTDHVIAFRDGPFLPFRVPECLAAHPRNAAPCSFPRSSGMADSNALYEAEKAAAANSTDFIDVTGLICPTSAVTCPVIWYDGTIMYRDEHHLTATFARRLVPFISRQLMPLVTDGTSSAQR